jgi:hypothetical protein
MDESWKLIPSKRVYGNVGAVDWKPSAPIDTVINTDPYPIVPDAGSIKTFSEQDYGKNPSNYHRNADLMEVDNWRGGAVKDSVFKLPTYQSSRLTKLINKESPTFMTDHVIEPVRAISPRKGGESEQVLASYKVLVPIFVPAIKRKLITTLKPPVRFVKEQITEMVPVKNIVPHVKEVIKAEKVPQQLITDYVATNDNLLPSNVDPSLRSGETLLTSVVKNIN